MINPDKNQLRKLARRNLANCSQEQLKKSTSLLIEKLASSLKAQFPTARRIGTFAALAHEPDLTLLHHLLPDREFYYPLVINSETIVFHLVSNPSTLRKGYRDIREPITPIHPSVNEQDLDLILVPGLAFDSTGARLGQGAGHYDRFLSHIPTTPTIGVTFQTQLLSSLITEPHDHSMRLIATEKGVMNCYKS